MSLIVYLLVIILADELMATEFEWKHVKEYSNCNITVRQMKRNCGKINVGYEIACKPCDEKSDVPDAKLLFAENCSITMNSYEHSMSSCGQSGAKYEMICKPCASDDENDEYAEKPECSIDFFAYREETLTEMDPLSTMVFDEVVSNDGNNYNSSSGIFTCSIPGKYTFKHSLSVNEGRYMTSAIMKNNVMIMVNEAVRGDTMDGTGSISMITDLQHGDQVQVQIRYLSQVKTTTRLHSTFSGRLMDCGNL